MANRGLVKTKIASGAITKRRIVVFGASDAQVSQANGVATSLIGVLDQLDAADTDPIDVIISGIADIEYGGAVTRGDKLTADAVGRAVSVTRHTHVENTAGAYAQNATTGVGSQVHIIGIAQKSGVLGDIGEVLLAPSFG